MSSTNRGAKRAAQDKYMTPSYSVDSLLAVLNKDLVQRMNFYEPCRGDGAIYNQISAFSKGHAELSEGIDYLTTRPHLIDLIITNPPFSLASEFLEKSLSEANNVIYLLRLNFLGAQKRKAFWNANRPTHVMVLSKRPIFVAHCKNCAQPAHPELASCSKCDGRLYRNSDSTEYAWLAWDRDGVINLPSGVHVL